MVQVNILVTSVPLWQWPDAVMRSRYVATCRPETEPQVQGREQPAALDHQPLNTAHRHQQGINSQSVISRQRSQDSSLEKLRPACQGCTTSTKACTAKYISSSTTECSTISTVIAAFHFMMLINKETNIYIQTDRGRWRHHNDNDDKQ